MTGLPGPTGPYAPTTDDALWALDAAGPASGVSGDVRPDGPDDPPEGTFTDPDPEAAAAQLAADRAKRDADDLAGEVRWQKLRRQARTIVEREEQAALVAARRLRLLDGWAFLAEEDTEELAIWGDGERWGWAAGEPLMLFGGNGSFKSTLSHLLVFARLGLIGPDGAPRESDDLVTAESPMEAWGRVLGMPVQPADGNVLYLAGDRPKQIRRAMRRLRRDWMVEVLHDRLTVHEGPLPFEITDDKDALADLAEQHKAADVVLDSLKDYCAKPSDEEAANGYNRARQECVARGMQWIEDHHNRKQQPGQGRTNGIEDVYGNRWLTAGAGSVLSMWTDEEGSSLVNVKQVKSPGEYLPQLRVMVDKRTGLMRSEGARPDPITFVRSFGPAGCTVAQFARYSDKSPNHARNHLNSLISLGQLETAPDQQDRLKRYRTRLGVLPQTVSNAYQQDGLPYLERPDA